MSSRDHLARIGISLAIPFHDQKAGEINVHHGRCCSLFEGKRMKIKLLLVDDERDFLEMLSERLEARGFLVRTAPNGEEALEAVREGGIDVVILDVRMPGMDGIAILHEIKRIKPLVEVVMLTGQSSVQKAVHGMKAGAFDYIMKPADIEDLLEKITSAHKRKSEQEERIRNAEIQRVLLTRTWE